jgi:hypothetical protein
MLCSSYFLRENLKKKALFVEEDHGVLGLSS